MIWHRPRYGYHELPDYRHFHRTAFLEDIDRLQTGNMLGGFPAHRSQRQPRAPKRWRNAEFQPATPHPHGPVDRSD